MTKEKAYKIVLDDLCKTPMFIGKYDAKHGSAEFMNGISTVMECIAYNISDGMGEQFEDIFLANLIGSQDECKALNKAIEDCPKEALNMVAEQTEPSTDCGWK